MNYGCNTYLQFLLDVDSANSKIRKSYVSKTWDYNSDLFLLVLLIELKMLEFEYKRLNMDVDVWSDLGQNKKTTS